MEGLESAGDKKEVKEVPPVPIKTYKWEDVRRARRRGGYPWTHLYKDPFEDLEDDDRFDMESTDSAAKSDEKEDVAKKADSNGDNGEPVEKKKKVKKVIKVVKKKVKNADSGEDASKKTEDDPLKKSDSQDEAKKSDSQDEAKKSVSEVKEETVVPLTKSDSKEETTSDNKETPLNKSSSKEDPLKKSDSKEATLKKSDSKEEPLIKSDSKEPLKKSDSKDEPLKKDELSTTKKTWKKSVSKEEPIKKLDSKEEPLKQKDEASEPLKDEPLKKSDSKDESSATKKPWQKSLSKDEPLKKSDSKDESSVTKKPWQRSLSKDEPLKKSDSKDETSATRQPWKKSLSKDEPLKKSDSKNESPATKKPWQKSLSRDETLKKSDSKDIEETLKRTNSKDETLKSVLIKSKSKEDPILTKSDSTEKPLTKSISQEKEEESDVIKTIQDAIFTKPDIKEYIVTDTDARKDERMEIDKSDNSNTLLPDSPDSTNVSISQYLDNDPIIDSKKEEVLSADAGTSKRAKSEEPGRKRKHSIESSYSRVSKYSLSKVGFMKKLKEATGKIKFPKLLSRSESKLNKKTKNEGAPVVTKKEEKLDVKKVEEPVYIYIPLKPPPGEKDEFSDKTDEDVEMPEEPTVKRLTPPLEDETESYNLPLTPPPEEEKKSTPVETEKKGAGKKTEQSTASKLLGKFGKKTKKEEAPVVKKTETKVVTKEVEPIYIHIPLKPPPEEEMQVDEAKPVEEKMQSDEAKPVEEKMQVDEAKPVEHKMQLDEAKPVEEKMQVDEAKLAETAEKVDATEEEKRLERLRKKLEHINKLAEEKKHSAQTDPPPPPKTLEAKEEPKAPSQERETKQEDKTKKESMFPSLKFDFKLAKTKKEEPSTKQTKKEEPKQAKKEESKLDAKKPAEPIYIHIPLKPPPGETDEFSHLEFEEREKPQPQPKLEEEKIAETPTPTEKPKGVQLIILTGPSEDEVLATPIPETPSDTLDENKMDELKTIARDVVDKYSPETKRKVLKERSDAIDLFEEKSKEKEEQLLKGKKGEEDKILEAQKTDDDKLEEKKVKMIVDEEDGLKTEAVIAQIITDEVHEQEKSSTPLLKKKVSFKRRSKDDDSGVYEDVQVTTEVAKPLEQTPSMSVEEEKTYLDEKLMKATSLEEDYNKWSKENDHEYEPVNPPPDNSGFTTPTTPQEEKKPSTPVTDSDIEYLAAKAADFELLSKVLKEVESEEKEKEAQAQESHGKKFQEAIRSSANKLHRQASMISNKVGSEAEKMHTRVKSIKRPKMPKMPTAPKFQKPHMPKMPTMPKMKKPTMPKMSKPKMPTMPKMSKPKMPESMKNLSMPTFKLPKRGSMGRPRRQLNSSTTESTVGGSKKKIFDFATYPRMFHRKKKESDPEINTPRTGTDITPTSEPSTLRPSFLFGNRWKKGKFTEPPAVDVAQGSLMSKTSERSDAQGSVRVPLHSEHSMDNESLDLRSRVEKEADMLLSTGRYDEDTETEAYMKENQEIHRASSLNAKLNDRWSHGVFHENTSYENEDTSNGQFASSYDNIPRRGVVEEINEDEFIIRQKGISRDNIQVREILTSEIKKSFGKSPDDQHYTKPDLGSSDASLPEVPKRRGLKKPKHKKTPHVSHEAITYDQDEPAMEQETEPDRRSYHEEIEPDRRSYQEPERPTRRSRSRKDHSLDSEGGRSLEHEHVGIRPKPMRRSRKDYSLDSQDYEPEISGEATPSSQMVSDENITRPKRKSRSKKQHSLDSYEGGPSYEISAAASYEISGNETPISYEISDENILSGNDYLDYKMYENEQMEGKEQPGIVVSDPYQESRFHPNFDDVPLAPPRKHKSLKSLNASELDSITAELGYKEISDQNLDFNLPHEYQIPTPDEEAAPQRPARTRSRTRSHSRYEEDTASKRTESILSLEPEENLEYIGYSVINKSHKEPKAPVRKRSIKSNKSEERKFHTVPRPLNDTQPVRPLRNYSTLGPSRPPRKTSVVSNLTDEEKENVVSPYIEIDDKDLQSGEVIQKMKDRPLPAPPRPPRKTRGRYLRDISQERNIMEGTGMETEVSVQTEPLPEGFECEELVQEQDDRVITPSIHKRFKNYEELEREHETPRIPKRPVTEYDHQETITHGTLLVQPYGRHEHIEDTPIQSFEKSTERVITVRREFDDTTEIPEDFKKLRDPETVQPQIIERIIEKHIPSHLDPTAEIELIKTHKLQVQDLDVDRLSVNELHANKIKVSEIDSSSITTSEINSNSGNLVVGGIELPASFFQQIVEKLQEQAEQIMPKLQQQQQEKLSSQQVQPESGSSRETEIKKPDFLDDTKSTQSDTIPAEDIPKPGDFLEERSPTAPKDEEHFLSEEASGIKKYLEEYSKVEKPEPEPDFLSEEITRAHDDEEARLHEEEHFLSEDTHKYEEELDHFLSEDTHKYEEELEHILSEDKHEEDLPQYLLSENTPDLEHKLEEDLESEMDHFISEDTHKELEKEELDPELQKQESMVKEYEDIATQMRLEEEKFQETLRKVEAMMKKSELAEGITPEEVKESIASEIDDLIKTATAEASFQQGIDEPSTELIESFEQRIDQIMESLSRHELEESEKEGTEIIESFHRGIDEIMESPSRPVLEEAETEGIEAPSTEIMESFQEGTDAIVESSSRPELEKPQKEVDEAEQKKTSIEETVECVEEVEPPQRPSRSKKHPKHEKDLIEPEISDLSKQETQEVEAVTIQEIITTPLEEATSIIDEGIQEDISSTTTEAHTSAVVDEDVPSVPERISSKVVERLAAKVEEQTSPLEIRDTPIPSQVRAEIPPSMISSETIYLPQTRSLVTPPPADPSQIRLAQPEAEARLSQPAEDSTQTRLAQPEVKPAEDRLAQPAEDPAQTRFLVQPTAPKEESEETPPPRPPRPIADSDYIPSQPPASFFALRSPPIFRDIDVDDDIPTIPRRRRHHKTLPQTPSSSDEIHPSTRRRQRTPEPSIPQLTSQLTRACVTAADKSLRRLIQQITNKVLGNADEKQDTNLIVVILLVLIACLILIGWNGGNQVHHHHWEYFNPPRDL